VEKKEEANEYEIPDDLAKQIKKHLKENPTEPWDSAVWNIAEENEEET
jgi:hypothetical protein